MGMFDYIEIEQPLKGLENVQLDPNVRPQTKSLGSGLGIYAIANDRLYLRTLTYEETDEPLITGTDGYVVYKRRLIDSADSLVEDFHGDIKITARGLDGKPEDLRLIARFTEGILQWIRIDEEEMKRRQQIYDNLEP